MSVDIANAKDHLKLEPHPEGGWFKEYWRSDQSFTLGNGQTRSAATAIHFLLNADDQSRWHTVASDELLLWQGGGSLSLILGSDGERPSEEPTTITLGPDLAAGQQLSVLIPRGVWQAAKPDNAAVLVSCVVSPGFDFADFALLDE